MSDLRIPWLRPVSALGPTPVQLLLDWFLAHEDSYLQSADQRKELRPLCQQLNASGVKCDMEDLLVDFQQLQEVLLDDSTLNQAIFKDLLPHRERLLHLVLVTKKEPEEEKQVEPATGNSRRKTINFDWYCPSPSGGPCATEIVVTWLQGNYDKLIRAKKKYKGKKLLQELVREIKISGHLGCTGTKVNARIKKLKESSMEEMRSNLVTTAQTVKDHV
ncbi:Leucine--tRNA ligase [Phytophthora cinnamomi]|uniref:Leucine--tRNA ligase n=1 Tax=Phytophthora cinnamomi TaxID=4785 RepID=UPI00355A3300|nr:Leucine--tRNA ligase [Phytophthora cinnamomi]